MLKLVSTCGDVVARSSIADIRPVTHFLRSRCCGASFSRTGAAKTFSLGFTINSDGLILCADGTVDFWTIKVKSTVVIQFLNLFSKAHWSALPATGRGVDALKRLFGC